MIYWRIYNLVSWGFHNRGWIIRDRKLTNQIQIINNSVSWRMLYRLRFWGSILFRFPSISQLAEISGGIKKPGIWLGGLSFLLIHVQFFCNPAYRALFCDRKKNRTGVNILDRLPKSVMTNTNPDTIKNGICKSTSKLIVAAIANVDWKVAK